MKKTEYIINEQLSVSLPEGFGQLSEEERSQLHFIEDGEGKIFSDPERHMIVSIGWKKVNGLAALILSSKDLIRNTEASINKAMEAYSYKLEGFLSRNVGSHKTEGFSYVYETQGVKMYAETLTLKYKKTFFYLYLYTRKELKNNSQAVWLDILESCQWK